MASKLKIGDRVRTRKEPDYYGGGVIVEKGNNFAFLVYWERLSDDVPFDEHELELADNGLETMLKVAFEGEE